MSARGWMIGGGAALGIGGVGAILVALGVVPNPFGGQLPPRGSRATVASATGPSGTIAKGHASLSATLQNSGTAAAALAAEAIILGPNGTIRGLWFQTNHPPGSYPGASAQDSPAWFQWRCSSTAPNASCTATFGTDWETTGGPFVTVVYAAPVAANYTGPLVRGKAIGAPASRLVDVVPGGSSLLVSYTGSTFEVS